MNRPIGSSEKIKQAVRQIQRFVTFYISALEILLLTYLHKCKATGNVTLMTEEKRMKEVNQKQCQ